jgi:hypothetical protein
MVRCIGPCNGSCAFPSKQPLARLNPLMRVELRLAPKLGATLASSGSSIIRALCDPLALVFGQRAQERNEAATDRSG